MTQRIWKKDTTASDEDLIMDPTYQDPTANDITDGETTDWVPEKMTPQRYLRHRLPRWDPMSFLIPI